MKKYWTIFTTSWSTGFVYRLNFLLWRIRSVILVLSVYFFWDTVFSGNQTFFGYTKEKILTYVFLTLILRSFILGVRSIDVGGEISDGRLANYLLRPVNYLWYWFTRDWADKLLNLIFAAGEFILLFWLLKPEIYFQSSLLIVGSFFVAVVLGIIVNFLLGSITSYATFWTPGNTWGLWFVFIVVQELLAGVLFPLDVLPKYLYDLVMLTPFPYLLYFPANLYLGKIPGTDVFQGLIVSLFWVVCLYILTIKIWQKGLRTYQAEGK